MMNQAAVGFCEFAVPPTIPIRRIQISCGSLGLIHKTQLREGQNGRTFHITYRLNVRMNASDSSRSSAALLEGLKELGLAPDTESSPSKSKVNSPPKIADPTLSSSDSHQNSQPKKSQRRSRPSQQPKGRRRRSPRLALLDLLEDLPDQALSADKPPEPPPGPAFEARIGDYLAGKGRELSEAFRTEVSAMLQHTDNIDGIVREFIADLRGAVRQAASFEAGEAVMASVVSVGESEIAQFRDPIAEAERLTHRTSGSHMPVISAARNSIKVRMAAVRETIGKSGEMVEKEVAELEKMRLAWTKRQSDTERAQSQRMACLTELDASEIMHRADQYMFEQLKKNFGIGQRGLGKPSVASDVRHFVAVMRDWSHAQERLFQQMRRKALEAAEEVEEMRAMRSTCEREHELFWQAARSATVSGVASPRRARTSRHHSLPIIEDEASADSTSTRTEASISDLRSRLESIQLKQDQALENLSLFLDKVTREVPKRRHHHRHH
jgi:hypothetical protein